MSKKKIIVFVLLIFIGCLGYILMTQSYPVAFVNWQPISLRTFEKDYYSAVYYYKRALETYNKNNASIIESSEAKEEVRRAVLDKLIENILIQQELKKRLDNNDLEKMVENKIKETLKETNISKEVETLYGLSLNDFKERILEPQAKQEIFESRLLLENKNFNDWQKEARNQAKVIILLPNLEWKEGQVMIIK